jgi:RHS repeat-associated protein
VIDYTYTQDSPKSFYRGQKRYELSNHLGNVLSVITDKRIQACGAGDDIYYNAQVVSVSDYYPFGMGIKEREWSDSSFGYRFGFNGKEQDNEVSGSGNSYDYGFRIYNPRLGKFLSVDPLTNSYPWYTPYQFAGNSPVLNIDLDGLEEWDAISKWNDEAQGYITEMTLIDENKLLQLNYTLVDKDGSTTKAVVDDYLSAKQRRDANIILDPDDQYADDIGNWAQHRDKVDLKKALANKIDKMKSTTPVESAKTTGGSKEVVHKTAKYKPGSTISLGTNHSIIAGTKEQGGLYKNGDILDPAKYKKIGKDIASSIKAGSDIKSISLVINGTLGSKSFGDADQYSTFQKALYDGAQDIKAILKSAGVDVNIPIDIKINRSDSSAGNKADATIKIN